MPKRLTHEEFVRKANLRHDDKYTYPERYINVRTKITIVCHIHGEFKQLPNAHLKGATCLACSNEKKAKTTEKFIEEAIVIHGDKYRYDETIYVNSYTDVVVYCNTCEEYFSMAAGKHVTSSKGGCPECAHRNKRGTNESFIAKAEHRHGKGRFNYDKVVYITNQVKVIIICTVCNNEFKQIPNSHLRGRGCSRCLESHGERECRKALEKRCIEYIEQYRIKDLGRRSFDFYFEYNERKYLLEYDGGQHFREVEIFETSLEERQEIDIEKTKYGISHGYSVIRIDDTIKMDDIDKEIELILSVPVRISLYVSDLRLYRWLVDSLGYVI